MPTAICECYWCFAACGRSPTNQTCPHDLCVFLCDLRVSVRLSPIGNSFAFDYFCSFFTCALFFPPNMLCNVSACAARMAEVNVLDCIRTRALRRSRIYRLRSARQNQCDALHHTGTHFRFDPLRVIRALGCFCCHHLHVRRSYAVAYISCRLTDPVRNDEFICVDIEIMLFTVCFSRNTAIKGTPKIERNDIFDFFFLCIFRCRMPFCGQT